MPNLQELPAELLTKLIQELPSEERFRMRQLNKKFHSIADAEGILPLDPCNIVIHFSSQVINVKHDDGKMFSVARKEDSIAVDPSMGSSDPPFRGYCIIGDDWNEYVGKYVKRLSKKYMTDQFDGVFSITLTKQFPDELLHLCLKLEKLFIQPEDACSTYLPLPSKVFDWLTTKMSPLSLVLWYALSPSQLDVITVRRLECNLTDSGAIHMLKKFWNRTVPDLRLWMFWIKPFPEEFENAISMHYGADDRIVDQYTQPNGNVMILDIEKCKITKKKSMSLRSIALDRMCGCFLP